MREIFQYSLSDIVRTAYALIVTKLFYRGARLIRRPFHIRGKKNLKYGKNFTTGYSCRFELFGSQGCLSIGDNCNLGDNVHLVASESVVIGNNFLSASKVFVSDTNHGNYAASGGEVSHPTHPVNDRPLHSNPVLIGDNVWLGENVVVLPGSRIGNNCVIGSNAVVSGEIPDDSIAVGAPAKVIKRYSYEKEDWVRV